MSDLRSSLDKAFRDLEMDDDNPAPVERRHEAPVKPEYQEPEETQDTTGEDATGEDEQDATGEEATGEDDGEDTTGEDDDDPEPEQPQEVPPSRFNLTAKGDWAKVPASVRREVVRLEQELTAGIQQHKERLAGIEPYEKMCREVGRSMPEVFASYVGMEHMLRENPGQGLPALLNQIGLTPEQAIHFLQNPQAAPRRQQPAPQDRELRERLDRMEREKAEAAEKAAVEAKTAEIKAWASQPGRERFKEPLVWDSMATFLEKGLAAGLDDAYEMACRVHPAPARKAAKRDRTGTGPAEAPVGGQQPKPGAPGVPRGRASSAASKKRTKTNSARDAIDRAFDEVGLG